MARSSAAFLPKMWRRRRRCTRSSSARRDLMDAGESHPTVLWELTRLCDLHCRGCPSGASEQRDPNELSTYEAYKTIDQIAALRPRELIITGGDPLERADVYDIIDYARRRGLDPSLVLVPTRELSFDAIAKLQTNGQIGRA